MNFSITRLDSSIPMPEYKTPGAVAFDLPTRETTTIQPKAIALIPTGIVVNIPEGCMLLMASRSSTPIKRGLWLANGIGVVDRDFCGPTDEVKVQVYNFTDSPVTIERGERIAQGIVVRIEKCTLVDAPVATGENRGGFGTTGK